MTIRLPIPPAILEQIRTTAPGSERESCGIHFHGMEVPAHQATWIRGYAKRWVNPWMNRDRLDPWHIGSMGAVARTVPQHLDSSMPVSWERLRRFVGNKDYLVMTLVQIEPGEPGPLRGVTVRIERIHLTTAALGEEVAAPSPNPPATP